MLPIYDRLEDCPAEGDCWLKKSWFRPVRNGLPGWYINSIGGWNTKAWPCTQPEAQFDDAFDRAIFAATAEEAIAAYHADREKCPFGEITLRRGVDGDDWVFVASEWDNETNVAILVFDEEMTDPINACFDRRDLRAKIGLEEKILEFQEAHAAGHPETSAIGRHIAQMQGGSDADRA